MPNIVLHNQFTETFVPILLNKSNHTNSDIKVNLIKLFKNSSIFKYSNNIFL